MTVILAVVLSFFACVRLYKELEIASLVLVILTLIVCILLITPISLVMSSMFDVSSKLHHNLSFLIKIIPDSKMKRILDRQLQACPLIRCQVGNFYHMESKAKLTVIHIVLNGIVFLLVNVK